jgi:D-glycero-D-manno-heptose 1,7-bisphosphate phosphatase
MTKFPGPALDSSRQPQPDRLRPAVFLDRDGTVNEEMGYINHLSRFVLLPQAIPAIRRLNDAGLPVVLITNQSGVVRGYYSSALVAEVHRYLHELLATGGAHLDAIYACLHGPRDGCACRKPQPGLVLQAARELALDLKRSYLVGDRYKDLETAARAGVQGILVLTGYGRGEYEHPVVPPPVQPAFVAEDLLAAVDWILENLAKDSGQ